MQQQVVFPFSGFKQAKFRKRVAEKLLQIACNFWIK